MSDIGYSSTGDEPSVASMMGGADMAITSARIGIAADTREISRLQSEFASLRSELEKVQKVMQAIEASSKGIRGPSGTGGTGTNGSIGNTPMSGGTFAPAVPGTQTGGIPAFGGAGRAGTPMAIAGTAANLVNVGFQAIDQRADRGYGYSLSADRMSLVYQQMYGMTQNEVSAEYRTPMAQFKLGAGGINALMGMQVSTGIGALDQASSVEALRAITGYSVSAGQMASMISQMASPEVVNRMFMMTGTSLIGPGGTQKPAIQVFQDIARRAGLTDERLVRSALLPGSITRANLTQMGVTGEMQDMVLQYAMQNIQYKQAGGAGMYDPSRQADRKLLGIEENFATQAEETDRLRVARDEQFYRRQADNFADLERQTQTLTRAMGALEDQLSGIIGAATGNRVSRGAFQIGGTVIGGALGFAFGGGPVGAMVGASIGGALGNMAGTMFGDGREDGDTQVPFGYGKTPQRITISDLSSKATFSNLHPTMRDRLERMFRDNPNVGIGSGYRSTETQRSAFEQRYQRTSNKTNTFWDGSYWEKKNANDADLAPPGFSMHEIGLAADLVGDIDWVVKNAHKYGLKTFKDVNNEPWHVQPAELPNSRRKYEESGAPWGTQGQPSSAKTQSPAGEHSAGGYIAGSEQGVSSSANAGFIGNQTITEKLAAVQAYVSSTSTPGGRASRLGGASTGPGSRTTGSSGTSINVSPGQNLTGEQVAQLLYAAGFRGEDLVKGVAIAKRESGWRAGALNPDRSTGDESYGLFQINMLGRMGDERLKWFGLSSKDELYDPATNVRAMKMMYDAKKKAKGNGWYDWGPYKDMPETYNTDMADAQRIVNSMNFGDPWTGNVRTGGQPAGNVSVNGGPTFNIAPNITINGSGTTQDLRQIAYEVARLIEREIRVNSMRSS